MTSSGSVPKESLAPVRNCGCICESGIARFCIGACERLFLLEALRSLVLRTVWLIRLLSWSLRVGLELKKQCDENSLSLSELNLEIEPSILQLAEARVDWRQFIWQKLSPFFLNGTFQPGSLAEVADVVNTHMWSLLRPEDRAS